MDSTTNNKPTTLTIDLLEETIAKVNASFKEPIPKELRMGVIAEMEFKKYFSAKHSTLTIPKDAYKKGLLSMPFMGLPVFVDHTLGPMAWQVKDTKGNIIKEGVFNYV